MTNVSNLSFATEEGIYLAASALALASKSGKIGFIGDKSEASAVNYSQVFARGAVAANSKIKVSSKLLDDSTADEVQTQVATGIDQLFSTWARSDEVIATIAALNDGNKKVLISGLLPDQYFLNFTIGKKNQYLTISKRFDLAVEQVISAEVAGKDILDILDSKKGIYGHRYNIKDGGVVVKTVSGSAFPAVSYTHLTLPTT